MVAVKRQTYRLAKRLGFKTKHHCITSVNRKTLYISEYDFDRMQEVFKKHSVADSDK